MCQNTITIRGHYGLVNVVLCMVRGQTRSPLGDIIVWSILFYARYGPIRFSVNQNHNALANDHMGRGHYGLLLSLDKQASFGISTWKQMLIQAKEIKDGGARWLAC